MPERARPSLGGWIARCFASLVVVAVAGALLTLALGALVTPHEPTGDRLFAFLVVGLGLPITWPLYLVALAVAGRRAARPRRWAIGLAPLLGSPFVVVLVVAITAPGVIAAWLAMFAYGALVPLAPRSAP